VRCACAPPPPRGARRRRARRRAATAAAHSSSALRRRAHRREEDHEHRCTDNMAHGTATVQPEQPQYPSVAFTSAAVEDEKVPALTAAQQHEAQGKITAEQLQPPGGSSSCGTRNLLLGLGSAIVGVAVTVAIIIAASSSSSSSSSSSTGSAGAVAVATQQPPAPVYSHKVLVVLAVAMDLSACDTAFQQQTCATLTAPLESVGTQQCSISCQAGSVVLTAELSVAGAAEGRQAEATLAPKLANATAASAFLGLVVTAVSAQQVVAIWACAGAWGSWGACSASCGGGVQVGI
jgi:hypothetical protein